MAKELVIIEVYDIPVKVESIRQAINFVRDNGLEKKAIIKADIDEDLKQKYIKKYPNIQIV